MESSNTLEKERRRLIKNAVNMKFQSGNQSVLLPRSVFFFSDPTANFLHDVEYMLQYKCESRVLVPYGEGLELELKKQVLWKKLNHGKDGPESMAWSLVEPKKELLTGDLFKKINAKMSNCDIASRLTFHLFLFGYHNSSNHSILPRDIIFEVVNHLRYFLQPTLVFGDQKGRVATKDNKLGYGDPTNVLSPFETGSNHWNSASTESATFYCELTKTCIVRRIIISLRCARTIEINAFRAGNLKPRTLLPRSLSGLRDLDGTNPYRIIEYTFPEENEFTDYIEFLLVKGGNVSLHWIIVYGTG